MKFTREYELGMIRSMGLKPGMPLMMDGILRYTMHSGRRYFRMPEEDNIRTTDLGAYDAITGCWIFFVQDIRRGTRFILWARESDRVELQGWVDENMELHPIPFQ